MSAKELLTLKLRAMNDEINFLKVAWSRLTEEQKLELVNNFKGFVPRKYLND